MKKQLRVLFTAIFLLGIFASCEKKDVNELNVVDTQVENESIGNTGGGHGGDPKGGD
ncbi:MAG: hypothetical protein ABJQ69_03445 [Ekhidna sp.]